MADDKYKPFLKWPGGKFKIIEKIQDSLPPGKKLIEPFLGSGSVFLNTNYENYILNDVNVDLISLFKILKSDSSEFIQYAKTYFQPKYNTAKNYYKLRKKFNNLNYNEERAALFLFFNRHGYNGLCRYNNSGELNVPFGRYNKPYFPETEMIYFAKKAKKAKFYSEDFKKTLARARSGDVVYCDPPYVPLSKTANFTGYSSKKFSLEDQKDLAEYAENLSAKGVKVVISNHFTDFTQKIYSSAKLQKFSVRRFISCNPNSRNKIQEVLASF